MKSKIIMKNLISKSIIITFILLINVIISNAQNIYTFAGNGVYSFSGDGGLATSAALYDPSGVAIDLFGNVYFGDARFGAGINRIRKVNISGIISTVVDTSGYVAFTGDGGPAVSANINFYGNNGLGHGIATDVSGNYYIADEMNGRIRKIDSNGIITTIAGTGVGCYSGDGGPAISASLCYPVGVAVDAQGNVYIADRTNCRIRKVDISGIITTIAGTGSFGFSGDGGPATSAQISYPEAIAVDLAGNIYIADYSNNRIRKVNTSGIINTVAGSAGIGGFSGDGGAATSAKLFAPCGVAVDASGNIYIVDAANRRVRKVNNSGIITTVAGTGTNGFSGDGGLATAANITCDGHGIAVDAMGNVYITDQYRIRVFTCPVGISSEEKITDELIVYPNPFSNETTLKTTHNFENSTIIIYNLYGQQVKLIKNISGQSIILNRDNLSSGVYFIKLTQEDKVITTSKLLIID